MKIADKVEELTVATAKVSPPTYLVWSGFTLNDLVAAATLIYVAIQAAFLARKWYLEEKARKENK